MTSDSENKAPGNNDVGNNETGNDFIARAPRFTVTNADEANVSVTRTEQSDHEVVPAQLVDVSQHGVKLRVPVNFKFEETLQLKIEVESAGLEYHGIASVRHIRSINRSTNRSTNQSTNKESWLVGCAIAPPLPDETFSYLATTSGKERRRFRRMPIAAEGVVRRQAQSEGNPVTLHNLSSGGFCFISEAEYDVGERVRLTLRGNDDKLRVIEALVCWQVDSPKGCIAGCQFVSRTSYADLCACLAEKPIAEPRRYQKAKATGQEVEETSKLVLTAAVLAMFIPPMLTLFLQGKNVSADTHLEAQSAGASTTSKTTNKIEIGKSTVSSELIYAVQAQAGQPLEDVAAESQLREWVDNTGKHRTQATLVKVTEKYIVLLKSNGRNSNVPWSRLSPADQDFARDWQANRE